MRLVNRIEEELLTDSETPNIETDFAGAGTDGEPVDLTTTDADYNIEEESTEHTAADSIKDTIPKVGTSELEVSPQPESNAQAETAGQVPRRRSTRQRREPDRFTHANYAMSQNNVEPEWKSRAEYLTSLVNNGTVNDQDLYVKSLVSLLTHFK